MAFAGVAAIGSLGGAVDLAIFNKHRSDIQATADSAALASAREMGLASTSESNIKAIAKQYVTLNFASPNQPSGDENADLQVDVEVDPNRQWVTVDINYKWETYFVQLISQSLNTAFASATASLAGDQSICMIALDENNANTLLMSGASSITANDCGVYSNSRSSAGLNLQSHRATLDAASTFTSGGFEGMVASFRPEPVTDSPPISDPLASRAYPPVDTCSSSNTNLSFSKGKAKKDSRFDGQVLTLSPGTYCGGVRVVGSLEVILQPGIYVFKDGPFDVQGNSTIKGSNVGLFFTGDTSTFSFTGSTRVNLTAPKDGPMAGILFFEDRSSPLNRDFRIETKDAELFEGTVYLPRGRFVIDKESRLGQRSNWTAIIAHQIETGNGPRLEINSNFGASTIPAPKGIVPTGAAPILTKRKSL